jgi:hypothetical protein
LWTNALRDAHVYSNLLSIALKSVTFINSSESNPKRENDERELAVDKPTIETFVEPMAGMALPVLNVMDSRGRVYP